jgi:hypothetical protein
VVSWQSPHLRTISLRADTFPTIRVERTLAPNETWQTGELRFERGGMLAMQVVSESQADATHRASIYAGDGTWLTRVELNQGAGRSEPLAPGDYELLVTGGKASAVMPFSVRAGIETRLDVPIVPGEHVTLACELPAGTKPWGLIALVVRDGEGRTAWRGGASRYDGALATFWLPRGTYTVQATWRELRGTRELTITGETSATIVLEPR